MPSSILSLLASSIGGIQGSAEEEQQQRDPNAPQKYDIDPSDPNRRVKHKKINSAFLKHQRWKEEQERLEEERLRKDKMNGQRGKIVELPEGSKDEVTLRSTDGKDNKPKAQSNKAKSKSNTTTAATGRSIPFLFFKWSLVAILCAIGLGQFIAGDALWGYRGKYVKKETFLPPTKVFSVAELAKYDGKDESKPVYLSILGHVYDVTPGRWVYGPEGSYHFFAGKDASRAYVTGCFHTHLTHDLRGLNEEEVGAIQEWKNFFDSHQRYKLVGRLDLPHIDRSSPIPVPCNTNAAKEES